MICVLDTGLANSMSVLCALERVLDCKGLRPVLTPVLTNDPSDLVRASRIIIPGVGTAAALMSTIHKLEIQDCLRSLTQPVLGICLGMQAFYDNSEEGDASCLGIFSGKVTRIKKTQDLPIPHMGWNQVSQIGSSQLLKNIPLDTYFYFVHSYRVPMGFETKAVTRYGEPIPAAIENSNWFGTQFHPERSGKYGEIVLRNFLEVSSISEQKSFLEFGQKRSNNLCKFTQL